MTLPGKFTLGTEQVFRVAQLLVSFNKKMDEFRNLVDILDPTDTESLRRLLVCGRELALAWEQYIALRTNVYGELYPNQ